MDIIFNSLVHHIPLKKVHVENSRVESMYFNFNRHIMRFSKDEFLLVIELWRSPVIVPRTVEVTGALQTNYFHNLSGT